MQNKIVRWGVRLWLLCIVLFAGKFLFAYVSEWDLQTNYPSFDKHASDYHSTRAMHLSTKLDNDINPYYTWYDLTKMIDDEQMKIYAYGPIEDVDKFKRRVLIVCGQHGRELVSAELCYGLIRLLQVYVRDEGYTKLLARHALHGVGYWIVPVMSPWSRQQVEGNNTERWCQRLNGRQVDLNRNFPNGRVEHQTRLLGEETYAGERPLSEYESRAIDKFIDYVEPHVLLNVHSGGEDILLPYDATTEQVPENYDEMLILARHAKNASGCKTCGLGMSSVLYANDYDKAVGTLIDYAVDYYEVDVAYTLEIFFNKTIGNVATLGGQECRNYFNPQPGADLLFVLRRWTTFVLALVEKLIEITE